MPCLCQLTVAEDAAIRAIALGRPGVGLLPIDPEKKKRRMMIRRMKLRQARLADPGAKGIRVARRRLHPPRHAVIETSELVKLGHAEETLTDLVGSGWITRWDVAGRPQRITFTSWGAEQAHLIIAENSSEVPHWERELPRIKGDPAPRLPRLILPDGYRMSRMSSWELHMFPADESGPEAECIAGETYLECEAVTETGETVRDPDTGAPKRERVKLMGVEVPIAKPRRKKVPKKKRK